MPKLSSRALALCSVALISAVSLGQKQPDSKRDLSKGSTLYVIPYAHLDTQWRWAYPQVIREYIANTLNRNFAMIDKYPHYVFNFTGARRYEFMRDYYPEQYKRLKGYIKEGRWFPAGSSMDENDVNSPSGESIIRQVLYGNEYFRKEFGTASDEYMLPDCFGFPYALPSLLAHAGLKGFSTQKLTWGSAVGIPFPVGVWKGPDGRGVVAALNPGAYDSDVSEDLSQNQEWLKRIQDTGQKSGAFVDFHYYGTGDIGGSPGDDSISWVEQSIVDPKGPIKVVSARGNEMFDDLTPDQVSKLPVYQGDLLLTQHSTGSLTSEAFQKRMNRKSELLADGAERASVVADWLGGTPYPFDRFFKAWNLVLGSQMHDMMAGTALPKGYEFIWNDEFIAQNQFAGIETSAISSISSMMNTSAQGQALLVYNPLSVEREDVVDATVPGHLDKGQTIQVFDPSGNPVSTQIVGNTDQGTHIIFLAKVPSCGFASFDARTVAATPAQSNLAVTDNSLENSRFKVALNESGDISSIWDKQNNREVLKAPARLDFQYENPTYYPAWNMDWADQKAAPDGYVEGPAKISILENGPVRVALRVERESNGSKFVQDIRLADGDAGDRIEVNNTIDWNTKQHALKASFPLTCGNPMATYDMQVGAVQRGNNDEKKYEVPQQQWLDLSQPDGQYGVGILEDSKYGSDKPNDDTVRLTLVYTPGTKGGYADQGTQDIGRQNVLYAIAPHAGDWRAVPWMAKRLNQPMRAFLVPSHNGMTKTFSFLSTSSNQVEVMALKKAEDGSGIIVRLRELTGQPANDVQVLVPGLRAAVEVDGQERVIGNANVQTFTQGKNRVEVLHADVPAFSLKAYKLQISPLRGSMAEKPLNCTPIPLAYDSDVASTADNPKDGAFNNAGESLPADQLASALNVDGVQFKLGSMLDGQKNAITARGQTINVPNDCSKVYVLAASSETESKAPATIIDSGDQNAMVGNWDGYIGQWDNRLWNADLDADFSNYGTWQGLVPGYSHPYEIAWFSNHKHDANSGNEFYQYSYLYIASANVSGGQLKLADDPRIKILAITAVKNPRDEVSAANSLGETISDHGGIGSPAITTTGNPNDFTTVSIAPPLYWQTGGIHYTLDGSAPTASSPVYNGPFTVYQPTSVVAAEFDSQGAGPSALYNVNVRDTTPASVVSATADKVLGIVRVQFSEPVDKGSAESLTNYAFSSGAKPVEAHLLPDGRTVEMTLDKSLTAGQEETVKVDGVKDLAPVGNVTKGASATLEERGAVFTTNDLKPQTPQEFKVDNLPVHSSDSFTLNFFCKPDSMPEDLTLIAGFGNDKDGREGTGRYFAKFTKGINFWVCDRDVLTDVPLDINQWQMLTATFDGATVRLYKNGKKIAEEADVLADDRSIVASTPLDAWDHKRIFPGAVRDLTVYNESLSDVAIQRLYDAGNKQ